MISAYIAYSIADRPGLAPAFITGMMCQNLGMGFIGGMVAGLACGYLANALKKVKVPMQVTLRHYFLPMNNVTSSHYLI